MTGVDIDYSQGRAWSEWTLEEGTLDVTINYTLGGTPGSLSAEGQEAEKVLRSLGQLLGELFALEER